MASRDEIEEINLKGRCRHGQDRPGIASITVFFVLWTVYAFASGIVAVPYNDIVARLIEPERRSRVLAASAKSH